MLQFWKGQYISQESGMRQKNSRKMPDQLNLLIKNAQTNLKNKI